MHRCDINNFGKRDYPLPPSCLVSVYGSPGAVPSLHYAVPLVGVVRPATLYIHRSLRSTPSSGSGKLLYIMCYMQVYIIDTASAATKSKPHSNKRSRGIN